MHSIGNFIKIVGFVILRLLWLRLLMKNEGNTVTQLARSCNNEEPSPICVIVLAIRTFRAQRFIRK